VEGKGWVQAKDLKAGDRSLVAATGKTLELVEVTEDHLGGEVSVYNFEVEGDHTYFVGEGEVWVHNAPPGSYDAPWTQAENQCKADANCKNTILDPKMLAEKTASKVSGIFGTIGDAASCAFGDSEGCSKTGDRLTAIKDGVVARVKDPSLIVDDVTGYYDDITGKNGKEAAHDAAADIVIGVATEGAASAAGKVIGKVGKVADDVVEAGTTPAKTAGKSVLKDALEHLMMVQK
jgi:hypothetical protein